MSSDDLMGTHQCVYKQTTNVVCVGALVAPVLMDCGGLIKDGSTLLVTHL